MKKILSSFNAGIFTRGNRLFSHEFLQHKIKFIIALIILTVFIGVSVYYFGFYEQQPAVIYAKKLKSLVGNVKRHIVLPAGENPVIATVTDSSVLPKETFFKNAHNGDKILMYKKNKKAILYRPSDDQIIAVAILDYQNTAPAAVPQRIISPAASVSAQPSSSAPVYPLTPQGKILIAPTGL